MTPARLRSAPHLSAHWPDIAARLRGSPQVAVFFDFDGTLVAFAARPTLVRLSNPMRQVLSRLARNSRLTLFVISGRRQADLARQLGIAEIQYLGLYGWEDGHPLHVTESAREALLRAHDWLSLRQSRYPGLWLEDKGVSLSVHVRDVHPGAHPRLRHDLRRLLRHLGPAVRLINNRHDAELVPRAVGDKGEAVRRVLARARLRRALPVYFGNDLSDESAFAAVSHGLAVIVGSVGPTRAHYAIPRRAGLLPTIRRLEAALP